MHRDIKPANMYVCSNGRLKLLDFGLACPFGTENVDFTGSLPYMSPEEIEGEAVDQRTDIYSLGISLYEMVTGRRPYPEEDLMALCDLHVEQDIPDPAAARPGMPERLRHLIVKACARDPARRFQRVEDVLEELRRLSAELDMPPGPLPGGGRRTATLHLAYRDDQLPALKKLLEDFGRKVRKVGAELKADDFGAN